MNKKIITILSVMFVIVAIGVLFFFFKKAPETADDTGVGTFPTGGEVDDSSLGGSPGSGDDASFKDKKSLIQLTQNAVSGAAAYKDGVRYVERATGHIYSVDFNGKNPMRVSNTTFLKSFETQWSPKADKLAIKYFEDIDNAAGRLSVKYFLASIADLVKEGGGSTATTTELKGVFLPASIMAIAVSPVEDKIFYLSSFGDITSGVTADFENKKQKNALETGFSEFNVGWPNKDIITLLAKPSAEVDGYLYFMNPSTKSFTRVMGGIKGLTSLVAPKGDKIVYSQSANNNFKTKIFDIKKKMSEDFTFLTLPEKCVWGKERSDMIYCAVPETRTAADYPDEWYQGAIHFDDSIWSKNISTGETAMLAEKFGADIIDLILSENENYLIFTNKKDGTLWSLALK